MIGDSRNNSNTPNGGPLTGLRVIDCATLFAGPVIASLMGDFGADVIKIEHPSGDSLRSMGWQKEGVSLWWTLVGRNKRAITLKLSDARGQDIMRKLVATADVVIENFRPGTFERWNLSPESLFEINPGLVIVRTTMFGQKGPYSSRPGFGTLAEAMSGYAFMNGWPDKPPTLPPFALADGVTALTGVFATMFALWWRDHEGKGKGQVIDLSIYEPLFWILGPQMPVYDQLGIVQERMGNQTSFVAPRNAYRTRDGKWLALSASSQAIAERVMRIIGRDDLLAESWFRDHPGRLQHQEELDDAISVWIADREASEVLAVFERHEAAIGPVYSIADIAEDPHYQHRETIKEFNHEVLGAVRMQNMIVKMNGTPGSVRRLGPGLGEHNREILVEELGVDQGLIDELRADGVI